MNQETSAFVGITMTNNIVYNIVHNEGEFQNTGLSIVHFLKTNKSKFLSLFMESQAYDGIDYILDDSFEYGEYMTHSNINLNTFSNVCRMIDADEGPTKYYYIYDMHEDMLLVKTPERDELIALDYKNSRDTRNFI